MSVDRNEKIWAYSNTGNLVHAFVQMMEGSQNHKRALCRKTITRNADAPVVGQDDVLYSRICKSCLDKAVAMWNRAEASMEPVNAYDQVCEGVVAADENVRIPADMNRELLRQAQAVAVAHERLFPKDSTQEHADADYVAPVENEQAVINALHAEAIDMDELMTAEAELVGKVFRTTLNHPILKPKDRTTVTRILPDIGSGVGVVYDVETDDWRGRRITMHGAVHLNLFRKWYELVDEKPLTPETELTWYYSASLSCLDDYNQETLSNIGGYVTAADWDGARLKVVNTFDSNPRVFLTGLRIVRV